MSLATDVRAWIDADPDAATRAELTALLERLGSGDEAARVDLADRFSGPLEFGTAGLRGRLGAGPHRMNRAVVLRAAHGLLRWLTDTVASDPLVVIGYDARHGSREFAVDTAGVTVAAGGRALLLPAPLPTPLLAFAVQHLGADAGVMVTASHNPKEDNGYKVYLGGRSVPAENRGAQIVPPVDGQIALRIAGAPPAADVPRAEEGWEVLGEELREAYLERLRTHLRAPAGEGSGEPAGDFGPMTIAVTAMHGVGGETVLRALGDAGFQAQLVPEQAHPDPDFPTIPFPNPEEPGALDLSMAFAAQVGADLILAVDPDADRCAAAIPDTNAPSGWRQLSGDETGALLGEQAARALVEGGSRGGGSGSGGGDVPESAQENRTLANSVVSSRLLGKIAEHHGLPHRVTLTGFKWISRAPGLAFGYEEAIGFCVDPGGVRDKDGISASVRLAQLADSLRRGGHTLQDGLDELAARHGVHHTAPLSIRVSDLSLIATAMGRLRAQPPTHLAGSAVTSVVDLSAGSADLPATDGLEYLTQDGDRVVVRPSGTEPKLKCYMEVVVPVEDVAGVPAARALAAQKMERLRTDVQAATGM